MQQFVWLLVLYSITLHPLVQAKPGKGYKPNKGHPGGGGYYEYDER